MPQLAAFAGLPGPTFSSSAACPWFFSPTPHQGEVKPIFSHLDLPLPFNSSTAGSHGSNGAGNRLHWCRSPTWLSKPHTGPHTGFSAQSLSRPFPYGERRGCSRIWDVPVLLDSPTTAPHGSNRAGNPFRWCRSLTWPQKPHTGSHKAKFGFHRLFLVRFFYGREAKSLSSL